MIIAIAIILAFSTIVGIFCICRLEDQVKFMRKRIDSSNGYARLAYESTCGQLPFRQAIQPIEDRLLDLEREAEIQSGSIIYLKNRHKGVDNG